MTGMRCMYAYIGTGDELVYVHERAMCMLMHTAGTCAGEERALTASRLVPRFLSLHDNLISGLPLGVFDALTSLW